MSSLDETKNFGLIMLFLGLLSVVSGILAIVDSTDNIIAKIGALIFGLMILTFGFATYGGKVLLFPNLYDQGVDSKFGVLATFITVLGMANIILGGCQLVDAIISEGGNLAIGATSIVVGIIMLIIAMFMKDGATTTMDKIIWIVLAIIFVLGIIGSLIGLFGVFGGEQELLPLLVSLLLAIARVLMFLMLFVYLISDEVKAKMGM